MQEAHRGRSRGHPLFALLFIVAGWIAVRGTLWESPFPPLARLPEVLRQASRPATRMTKESAVTPSASRAAMRAIPGNGTWHTRKIVPLPRQRPMAPSHLPVHPALSEPMPSRMVPTAAVHELLLMAAFSPGFFPADRDAAPVWRGAAGRPPANPAASGLDRWSFDGWMFARRGSSSFSLAGLGPSYGASQAGGVLRYRIGSGPQATSAYVRASAALAGPEQSELAAGVSARPLADIPFQVMAEARAQRGPDRTAIAPAVALVSALPPMELPQDMTGELYAAGGYVGGAQRTAFFDLQAVADRAVGAGPGAGLRLGAGLWAGGQKGAQRADVGPRASVALAGAQAFVRVAADYRFRIAGNAAPDSGPAVTISASF